MIESKSIDLARPVNQTGEVIGFTNAGDIHWTGIVDLPAHACLTLDVSSCNDLYILQGELSENAGPIYTVGAFLRRSKRTSLIAGPEGARLFKYQDRSAAPSDHTTVTPNQLDWREGGAVGMKVASLVNANHRLMLVSWIRGTQMRLHDHPMGEEIFVLTGQLQDQHGRYPAGTWQRLYPETSHSPYSETHTLILLRNGHLHFRDTPQLGAGSRCYEMV